MSNIPMAGSTPQPTAGTNPLTPELKAAWDRLVAENDLVLFMKGTPDAPQCGFSNRAAEALKATGHPFAHVDVFAEDPATVIPALAVWADFPTLPQVWVKGELIGGSDIAAEMVENGELEEMLAS